jgi:REP element-mobilizing transposase RayT
MSKIIRKEHNASIIMYHIVCLAKYRRLGITKEVDEKLKETCKGIEVRYEIKFLEIGAEKDHVHFLVQLIPSYSPAEIVQKIKSIIARKIFEVCPEVKKLLWGGEFWTRGYYIETVGEHEDEEVIGRYVRNQGRNPEGYEKIYENKQLELFD